MRKFLDARTLTGAAVGIVVALGAAALFGLFRPERPEVDIYLKEDAVTHLCKAQNPVSLQSKHKKKLTWNIYNQCREAQFVQLKNFAERTSAGVGPTETGVVPGDLVKRGGPSEVAFPPGVTLKGLETTPLKTVDHEATYKYEIYIGTALPPTRSLDPDIEWWK